MSSNKNNNNIELITGDPKRAIRKLSVPMMVSMLLIKAYNLADSIWVAGLGSDALAAIGFITPLFMIIVGLGNGVGAGANSLIARYIGAKNKGGADNSALHAVIMSIIISIIFSVIIIIFLKPILELMGAGSSITYAMEYGTITFAFLIVFVFSGVASAIFRSEGDVKRATYAIAVTAVLNIILDPIFIYVFNLGIAGAAWATILSASISCIIMIYWIWGKKDLYLDLNRNNFKYNTHIVIETLKVAIPSTAENFVISILAMVMNGFLVICGGTDGVAVYTAAMRIIQIAMIPLIGLGTALITVVGVAYGSHNYKNLSTGYNYSLILGFVISAILGVILIIFSNQIAFAFSYSSSSAYLAPKISDALKILSLFVLAVPLGIMSSMTFQGVGKGTTSLIITLLRSLIFEMVFAYLFAFTFNLGTIGIYIGVVLGCGVGCIIGLILTKIYIRSLKNEAKIKYNE